MRAGAAAPFREGKKDSQHRGSSGDTHRRRETEKDPRAGEKAALEGNTEEYRGTGRWASYQAVMEGVPGQERAKYTHLKGYHRCGRTGHRSSKCYATCTKSGTTLPQTPWKVSAGHKQQREQEEEPILAAKV